MVFTSPRQTFPILGMATFDLGVYGSKKIKEAKYCYFLFFQDSIIYIGFTRKINPV